MRDFSQDHSQLSLNTATLGHNLDGFGAGWTAEQVIEGCAKRGFGGITFWRRELEDRAYEIGQKAKAAGMSVTGLCRTPYITGREAGSDDDIRESIEMAAALGTEIPDHCDRRHRARYQRDSRKPETACGQDCRGL